MKMEEINNIMKLQGYYIANIEDYLVFYKDKDSKIKKIVVLEPDTISDDDFNIIDTIDYEDVEKVDTVINTNEVDNELSEEDLLHIEDKTDNDDEFFYLTVNNKILFINVFWGKYLYLNNKVFFTTRYIVLEELEGSETVNG